MDKMYVVQLLRRNYGQIVMLVAGEGMWTTALDFQSLVKMMAGAMMP